MSHLVRVPEVAAGATEVVLSQWLVSEGSETTAGTPIAVVETEKATVEIESDASGVLLRTLCPPGVDIAVGAPMALIGSPADLGREDAILAELGAAPAAAPAPAPAEGDAPEPLATSRRDGPPEVGSSDTGPRRIFISPLARKLLSAAGLDPHDVPGTGPHGRITRRDVDRAIAGRAGTVQDPAAVTTAATTRPEPPAQAPSSAAGTAPSPGQALEPHTRLRQAVATRLSQSKREVPHFYLRRTADLDALLELRTQLNEHSPHRISVNDLVVRAVAAAHCAVPDANVIWTDEGSIRFSTIDVSIAVASDRGLVTPVVRDLQDRSITSISTAIRDLVDRANAGGLHQHELEGGSVTVTNLGMYGVDEFAAIINPPQSCIVAVGAASPRAVVRDGAVTVATQVTLTLSVDHRVIDGALAAQWFQALVSALENPYRLVV